MNPFLFNEFNKISPAAWKQKIQVDLKGEDYNKTLLWKTSEEITVKPFYTKEDRKKTTIALPKEGFSTCQSIFVDDEKIANYLALDALKRGASSIQFTAKKEFNDHLLFQNIDFSKTTVFLQLQFLSTAFIEKITRFIKSEKLFFQIDIIHHLAASGNWYSSLKEDFNQLAAISKKASNTINVDASLYQNAGATMVQQLAYALAVGNEYLHHFGVKVASEIHFNFAVGSNYFFEIAKLRAFRVLWQTLLEAYDVKETITPHLFVTPSLRNKTLYDYNVNMLRTTSECMSAILGGANTISNISYDTLYHKSNEFGERIARNQLLILQEESYLKEGQQIANGAYYIENITHQLAKKALAIFKQIEKGGGFLKQLKEGTIQRKINESATKEQQLFNQEKIILLGSNFLPNKKDKMIDDLEIYPFIKQQYRKTLIPPIIKKRLSEDLEKERLQTEKNNSNGK